MTTYFDTSALAKTEIPEPESGEVRALFASESAIVTSVVTLPEFSSALLRAVARGALERSEAELGRGRFARLWPQLARLDLTTDLLNEAEAMVWNHGLRGFDGIHLASALAVDRRLGDVGFATFDRALWRAARDEGLAVWPPELRD